MNKFNKLAAAVILVTAASQASALTLYVNPAKGNDAAACGKADPCKTLRGAHNLLVSARPNENVTISVAKGTFNYPAGFVWKYTRLPYTIRITGAGITSTVLDGKGAPGTWLTIATPLSKAANITVANMTIRNYGTAITAQGVRTSEKSGWISGVVIDRMSFSRIGGKYTTTKADTYAAVRFVNARKSIIKNSKFTNIENAKRGELMHAVYLAHYSSDNRVTSNSISVVSGDPLRTRDSSSRNTFSSNRLVKTGVAAHYSDWYCTGGPECTKGSRECPSANNVFKDNALGVGYTGKRIATFQLFFGNACGVTKRLSTAGNRNL